MIDRGKRNLLGINITAVDYDRAVAKIVDCAHRGISCSTTALAVHGLVTGARDPAHRFRLNHFDLVVPDGQAVRWAVNLRYGVKFCERVGPILLRRVAPQPQWCLRVLQLLPDLKAAW